MGSYDAPTVSSTVGVISLSALWATPYPTLLIATFTGERKFDDVSDATVGDVVGGEGVMTLDEEAEEDHRMRPVRSD